MRPNLRPTGDAFRFPFCLLGDNLTTLFLLAAVLLQNPIPIEKDPAAHPSERRSLIESVDAGDNFASDSKNRWRALPDGGVELWTANRDIQYGTKTEIRYHSFIDATGRYTHWQIQILTPKDVTWQEETYDYEKGEVTIKNVTGTTTTETKIPIPQDLDVSRDQLLWFRTVKPEVGAKATCRLYSEGNWVEEDLEYEGDEVVQLRGAKVNAHRIIRTWAGQPNTMWLGPDAELLFEVPGKYSHWQSALVPTTESGQRNANIFSAKQVAGGYQFKTPMLSTLFVSPEGENKHYRLLDGVPLDGAPGAVSNPLLSYPGALGGHDVWPLEVQTNKGKATVTFGRLIGDPPPKWAAVGWAWNEIFPGGGRETEQINDFPVVSDKPDPDYSGHVLALRTYATPTNLKSKDDPPAGILRFEVAKKTRKAISLLQVRRYPNGILTVDVAEQEDKEVNLYRFFLLED